MIFAQAAATLFILVIGSLGPGLCAVRYLHWRPLETLCASVALSFLFLYLTAFTIYGLNLPTQWAYVPVMLAIAATAVCTSDIRRLWRHPETRSAILAFLAATLWLLIFVLLLKNYSGADWYGDWLEHWQRAVFFSAHLPLNTQFLGGYILPARPPMMNLLTAQIFWQVSTRFEVMQIVFVYLNALVILPCVLIASSLVPKTRNRAWLIAGFLALSPLFVQNGIYTWTKAFTTFYDLVALGLYLSAWRRNHSNRMIAAFACLATAMLIHYSAAAFALFLMGHYLFCLFYRRPGKWREIALGGAIGSAIFITWLGWSLYAYGVGDTFGSNTTVTASEHLSVLSNLHKVFDNTFSTIVPYPLREPHRTEQWLSAQGLPAWRDLFFVIYQTEFPTMLGLGSLILVFWYLTRDWPYFSTDSRNPRRAFWLSLVGVVTFLGIAINGAYNNFGVGQVCLQPLALLGVTLAAVALPHASPSVRLFALLGLLVDAVLGIMWHMHYLHKDFARTSADKVGPWAIDNYVLKRDNQLLFLGDHVGHIAGALEIVEIALGVGICFGLWVLSRRSVSAGAIRPLDSSA